MAPPGPNLQELMTPEIPPLWVKHAPLWSEPMPRSLPHRWRLSGRPGLLPGDSGLVSALTVTRYVAEGRRALLGLCPHLRRRAQGYPDAHCTFTPNSPAFVPGSNSTNK